MNKRLSKLAAAAIIYAAFAVYLYQPYFRRFNTLQHLLVVNFCLASLGCYLLSCRWVIGFWGPFFAGAIYGFGPFSLGLAAYHPSVSLLSATIPWLFFPAAFVPKTRWRWTAVPLSALPFLAILLFFQVSTHWRLFAIPIQTKLRLADLAGLLAPLVRTRGTSTFVGFYQVPIAPLIMGFSMLLAARRFGIMTIFAVGMTLAFCGPFLNICPIIWLAIPVLCCSVLVGEGMQGLASAGFADRKWALAVAVIMGVLSIVTLLLATKYFQIFAGLGDSYAKLLVQTAKMYVLGAVAVAVVFFMARAKLRLTALRLVSLGSAMAIDIFLGASFVVDKIL